MPQSDLPNGIFAKKPHPNAPDFVKGAISLKRADAIEWLQQQDGEWVNLDMKESRNGKYYLSVNDYKPEASKQTEAPQPESDQALPF